MGNWRYDKKRGWLIRKLRDADDAAWCADGWEPTTWQLFAARMLSRIERWRAAWLSLSPPPVPDGYCEAELVREPWHRRVFYRCKAALCLAIGLAPGERTRTWCCVEVVWFDLDHHSWSEVNVGEGVWKNWWVSFEEHCDDAG